MGVGSIRPILVLCDRKEHGNGSVGMAGNDNTTFSHYPPKRADKPLSTYTIGRKTGILTATGAMYYYSMGVAAEGNSNE